MANKVYSGALDRRVTFLRAVISFNSFNEPESTWSDLIEVWARYSEPSAAESYRAQEVGAEISARFLVRRNSVTATIDERDRVSYRGRDYNITGVRDVDQGRNRFREIDAVARAQNSGGYEPQESPGGSP